MDNTIGRVVAVAGSQMTATLEVDALTEDPVRIGAMVKVRSAHLDVIGTLYHDPRRSAFIVVDEPAFRQPGS